MHMEFMLLDVQVRFSNSVCLKKGEQAKPLPHRVLAFKSFAPVHCERHSMPFITVMGKG